MGRRISRAAGRADTITEVVLSTGGEGGVESQVPAAPLVPGEEPSRVRGVEAPPGHVRLSLRGHAARAEDFQPNPEGYDRMASVWDDFAGWSAPDYGRFLASAEGYF